MLFFHFRKIKGGQIQPRGGITAAVILHFDKEGNVIANTGIAVCDERDQYAKRQGRMRATERLGIQDKHFCTQFNLGEAVKEHIVTLNGEITIDKHSPYSLYSVLEKRVRRYVNTDLAQALAREKEKPFDHISASASGAGQILIGNPQGGGAVGGARPNEEPERVVEVNDRHTNTLGNLVIGM